MNPMPTIPMRTIRRHLGESERKGEGGRGARSCGNIAGRPQARKGEPLSALIGRAGPSHHFQSAVPQFSPAPKPEVSTRSPRRTCLSSRSSSRAMGIEPPEVLPYFSRFL